MIAELGSSVAGLATTSWPLGLAFAVVLGGERLRERRRRTLLNRAMHELRRPLQALVLAGAPEPRVREALEMTVSAVEDLDREINREEAPPASRPVNVAAAVHSAVERWRRHAAVRERALAVQCHTGKAMLLADPDRLSRALDNLISNALEHGRLRVEVAATICAGRARIAIADGGCPAAAARRTRFLRRRDPRHGHGLGIVTEIARELGGRFFWVRSERGSIAVLELPVADAAA